MSGVPRDKKKNAVSSYKLNGSACFERRVRGKGVRIKLKKYSRAKSGKALFVIIRNLGQLTSVRNSGIYKWKYPTDI